MLHECSGVYMVAFRAGVDPTATNMWLGSDSKLGESRLRDNSHITLEIEILNVLKNGLLNSWFKKSCPTGTV